jgi:hypothetical protein
MTPRKAWKTPKTKASFPRSLRDDGGGKGLKLGGEEKTKPDGSLATNTGHLDVLRTETFPTYMIDAGQALRID